MSVLAPILRRRVAFTLNELLIVIAIIVLMLALAVPAFNVLTGSKSIEGATNQVSAFLGQARAEAIGIQETRGAIFFIDPGTDRINIAMVRATPAETADNAAVTYLDLVADRDFLTLPSGIGIQTIDNAVVTAGARADDGYVGFNTNAGGTAIKFGGVILFDAYGKLVSLQYGFRRSQSLTGAASTMTAMGSLLASGKLDSMGTGSVTDLIVAGTTFSQLGLAIYDLETFKAMSTTTSTATDPQIEGGSYAPNELAEETWIDSNAVILLVNRYNGTLVKGD